MAGKLTISTLNDSSGVLATQNGMTGIAKAWVNFVGSSGSINNSFNVSSVTRNGTGDYTANFTTAMPNANYTAVGSGARANDGNNFVGFDSNTYSTTQVKFTTKSAGSLPSNTDMIITSIIVLGS